MSLVVKRLLALLLLGSLILAACGGQPAAAPTAAPAAPTAAPVAEAPTAAPVAEAPTVAPVAPATSSVMLPDVNPATITGDIIVAGSSTVFPLTERMAELFNEDGYRGQITIDSIGSGAGFERFCVAAESDISNASRPINDRERESCAANGREAIEFRVGTDALAIVVSSENDFVTNLTIEQLAAIYSGAAATWADVDASYPAEAIQLFSPGTDSGTFDYFVEEVFDSDPAPMLAANPQLSEDDNVLVAGVEGSPYAIGYFGYAYYQENASRLKILDIEGVEPTEATTEDGSYPLARPLFIYSAATIMAAKPQVAAFINYYLTYVNDEVVDVGYFPASAAALDTAKNNWLAATSGAVAMPAPAMGNVTLPDVDPASITGDIIVAGSSTVFPLTERMAELFNEDGYRGQITIDSIGSGAGFERFCVAAESDISNASRPINDRERESCAANGREAIEFRVGTDALAIVVSSENDFVTNLTIEQLAAIYSGAAATWADVDASYPAEAIQLFSPGTDSGTFDYFVEEVFDSDPAPMLAANPQLSEDDNVLVAGVEGSPYAIGYFGYAYYQENASRLKILDIEGVEPTEATTEDGSYPLARPLFIYSAATIMAAKPQVAAFINYYLTYVNDEVVDVGYFPASAAALNTARQNWLDAQ
ncbi:MAG TPA: PstS family phosphate ABC transporter substrate-binding protein [Roseiflexaceae bacterium]|nr:PstS family phosphate ABC transporter substrate-binding protein [Roseiflexaceae bacterium]HMP39674.1 PstS family phosphate ABC transporter substrate-binding protein [Roseiflexaceae bacterium]